MDAWRIGKTSRCGPLSGRRRVRSEWWKLIRIVNGVGRHERLSIASHYSLAFLNSVGSLSGNLFRGEETQSSPQLCASLIVVRTTGLFKEASCQCEAVDLSQLGELAATVLQLRQGCAH